MWKRLCLPMVAISMGALAQASLLDATVLVERAANNRSFTVRYSGAQAALIELRIGDRTLATRLLDRSREAGEAIFSLDPAELADGEHEFEIRLFNADGQVLATQKSKVNIDRRGTGPVQISRPQSGTTVRGTVQISVDFRESMPGAYVSFFINDQIKSLGNTSRSSMFLWDTERERNGWHEIHAWVVDGQNNTWKTEKIRLFVANPGGRTDRRGEPGLAANPMTPSEPQALRGGGSTAAGTPVGLMGATTPSSEPNRVAPILTPTSQRSAKPNPVQAPEPAKSNVKAATVDSGEATGPQTLRPALAVIPLELPGYQVGTLSRVGGPALSTTAAGVTPIATVAITYGTRLPEDGTFAVLMDGRYVDFDVSPRVAEGVPITPFRHLFQEAGGKVHWDNLLKEVSAQGLGRTVWLKVGEADAKVDGTKLRLELAPFIERGRVLVPMSFMVDALRMDVRYDVETGHVVVSTATRN
ncbi:MAG: stalk domain-containing protein [Fimbriimonadaceae bacterium]|nr:stalk domain-containing protein [Fimbriimonadaceae bacterium]